MTHIEPDPACTRHQCPAPNHCPVHHTHHAVDSMARHCEKRAAQAAPLEAVS